MNTAITALLILVVYITIGVLTFKKIYKDISEYIEEDALDFYMRKRNVPKEMKQFLAWGVLVLFSVIWPFFLLDAYLPGHRRSENADEHEEWLEEKLHENEMGRKTKQFREEYLKRVAIAKEKLATRMAAMEKEDG